MCLVNCGKPIEIGHARRRIYGVMPLFQLLSILWYLWNKITFGHQMYIYYVSSEFWEAYWNWACSSNDLRSYAPFFRFLSFPSVRPSIRYHDISETKSCRATNFGYVMYLVNCGKPIEIGHARHRIYGVMPLIQLFSILWYLWNKITFGHQLWICYVSSELWEAYGNWACSSNDLRSYAPFSGFCRFRLVKSLVIINLDQILWW